MIIVGVMIAMSDSTATAVIYRNFCLVDDYLVYAVIIQSITRYRKCVQESSDTL